VGKQILNGTSAQLAYTVPLTLVDAGKYMTQYKLNIQKYPRKSKQCKTQQNKTTVLV